MYLVQACTVAAHQTQEATAKPAPKTANNCNCNIATLGRVSCRQWEKSKFKLVNLHLKNSILEICGQKNINFLHNVFVKTICPFL